jgi:gliding motility-associated-like protein
MFIKRALALFVVNKIFLFILFTFFTLSWSSGQSSGCVDLPSCSPCVGSLTSITLRYSGPEGPPNRYRVSDDGGQFANQPISGDIFIDSRLAGQPFEGNRLILQINVGGGFGDGIEILTNCNEIILGKEYDHGNLTVISAVSSTSGLLCCEPEEIDQVPPEFVSCTQDITVSTAASSCNAVVEWESPQATDNCEVADITSNFESGVSFPVGSTEVIYIAIDGAGNEAYCSFNVVVKSDSELEVSDCPTDITEEIIGDQPIEVEWEEPQLIGACGSEKLQSTHQPGEKFALGETKVIYSYLAEGETVNVCTFVVNVISKRIEFDIPKILTLNNDGINDEWTLGGIEFYSENQVIIFDRWGGEVHNFSGYNNDRKIWRGENKKGTLVPTGTYFYVIKAISGADVIEESGFLELIR